MLKDKIPKAAIPRLSLYYRILLQLQDKHFISSKELSQITGLSSAQIRRDLSYFGRFGKRGSGYYILELRSKLSNILGVDKKWKIALVGVGNLGVALLNYRGFKEQGFQITRAFDNDPKKVGKTSGAVEIQDTKRLIPTIKKQDINIALLAVPAKSAQDIVDRLAKTKVRVILNFAPIRIIAPPSINIFNVDLSIELEKLAYFLTHYSR